MLPGVTQQQLRVKTFKFRRETRQIKRGAVFGLFRLMSYMFARNFEAIDHVIWVLEPKNRPASLA